MRFSRSARRSSAVASLALAMGLLLAACDGDRVRPGPPSLVLEGPAGGTVFSPDTIGVAVFAADPNGLDSITVGYLDQIITIEAFARVEITDVAFLHVPEGLSPGQVVTVTGVATDIAGQQTRASLPLSVIPRP